MVDLSHSGERTCLDAIAASKAPISINHTGCRALNDLPRNKTDAELRGVAQKGGFVGIYFMPFLSPSGHARAEDVVAHIDHAVNVCGEDHVGIGTDGSVTAIDDLAAYRGRLAKEVADRAKAGIGAKGERADTYPFVVDLRGVEQFRKLAGCFAARGYSTGRIEKILGLNFLGLRARSLGRLRCFAAIGTIRPASASAPAGSPSWPTRAARPGSPGRCWSPTAAWRETR